MRVSHAICCKPVSASSPKFKFPISPASVWSLHSRNPSISTSAMAQPQAHVLLIPFPAQGHMLPLLDLAHNLSTAGLTITVAVTTKNLPLLSPLLARSPTITPLVLPFPSNTLIPPGIENTQHLHPSYFQAMIHALAALHHPLLTWAQSHPHPITSIISDMFLGWTNTLAADLSIPRLNFTPSGALTMSISNCLWRDNPDFSIDPVSFTSIPNSPVYPWRHLSPIYRQHKAGDPFWDFIKSTFLNNIRSWGWVVNSFDAFEGNYLTHLRSDLGHSRVWGVGPLCSPGSTESDRGGPTSVPAAELLSWLDNFDEGSVLYVCFGSQAMLSPPQAAALGAALEKSGARFVWCMRGDGDVPEGLEERVAGRGKVVRGWAPQVALLGHPAVGWFLTHCGWNSTLEAVAAGVAMLMWPLTADQFMNARLVEETGVGVEVVEGEETVPDVEGLARVVKETVGVDRPERKRAAELKRMAAEAVVEGGSSHRNMEELVKILSSKEI